MGRWTPRYCKSMARVGSSRFIFNPTEQKRLAEPLASTSVSFSSC